MAILVEQIVVWQNPSDPSVVSHRLYYAPEANSLGYDSSFVEISMPSCEYNLSQLPINANGENYKLALTAVDAIGNESDLSAEKVLPLDNTPPSTPVWLD